MEKFEITRKNNKYFMVVKNFDIVSLDYLFNKIINLLPP